MNTGGYHSMIYDYSHPTRNLTKLKIFILGIINGNGRITFDDKIVQWCVLHKSFLTAMAKFAERRSAIMKTKIA